jgi:hypothetical protein
VNEKEVKEQTKKIIGKGRRALRLGVNIFVYTFVSIFMLLMILFGVSQTSLFKDWLRDKVVEIANEELNGKLSIGKIEGTIFTSLIIKDVTLSSLQNDTVVSAGKIELRTSPLKILFKNIYVRKFELSNAKIKLIEEPDGELNLLKIFPKSDEPEDTTSSEFPFTIEVADFALKNINLSMQRYDKVGSTEYYPALTTEDLRIKDLNLSLSAFADINKYNYRLTLNDFSFTPNFHFSQMEHLSGTILLTRQLAGINKLHLITRDSDVELSAAIQGVDFLEKFSTEKLSVAPVRFTLSASDLNFGDVATYVPPMAMLNGKINSQLEASGIFNELVIKKFDIAYNNTNLKAKAKLKNLLDADNMYFDLNITDSNLDLADPNKLFKDLELPEYKEFGMIKIDTLTYQGSPLDFKSNFAIRSDKGSLSGNAIIDLRPKDMIYEIKLLTNKLELSSFTSIPTDINSEINISGAGFDPQKMKMNVSLNAASTTFGNKYFRNIELNSFAENGLIKTSVNLQSDSTIVDMIANIDFTNNEDPSYEIKGYLKGLNLATILNNDSLSSDINLNIEASGTGFNPDSLDLFLVTDIQNTSIMGYNIDSTRLIMDLRRNDNGKKVINIISDIADLTISGDYQITSLGDLFAREGEVIQSTMRNKINPIFFRDSSAITSSLLQEKQGSTDDCNLEYLVDFKEQMIIDISDHQLELDGLLSGIIKSKNDSLIVTLNSNIDYVKYWNDKDVLFLINAKINSKISNRLINNNDGNINANFNFDAERVYSGGNIYNINSAINLKNDVVDFNFSGEYEDKINAKVNAIAQFAGTQLNLNIETIDINYNNLNISNNEDILLSYNNQSINFDDFLLNIADGVITATGSFGAVGEHSALFKLDSLTGNRIVKDAIGTLSKDFDADINLTATLSGNFSDPVFSINASAKNIKYGAGNFGSLTSDFNYSNSLLYTDIKFLDSLENIDKPALIISGSIPLLVSKLQDSTDLKTKSIDLTIQSDEYDLSSLKEIIPFVQFQKGTLESDIYLSGTLDEPVVLGYFSINNSRFKIKNNNLDYDFNTKVWIDDQDISIESIELKNVFGTKNGGSLRGEGFVHLDKFKLDSTFIKINGDLKVLDQLSKNTNPFVYGDLALMTRGDIIYSGNREKSYLNLPIDITVADLIMPLGKSAYSSTSGFVYQYADYSTQKDKLQSELDSLIQFANREIEIGNEKISSSKFNYTIDIKLVTEAEVDVVLSKELGQNLVAVADGDFFMESIDGKNRSSGQLNLLDGSSLNMFKKFEARGNVKFDKLDDPIIDITSLYKNYWQSDPNDPSTEQEVGIKIKLKGPLSELDKNFLKDENNVGVYMGRQAIEDDKKDESKDITDAMFFIITGKFPDDANQQDKNLVASYTTDIAGSLIGGVLNQYLGDYVKGFNLRQSGTETVFNLRGEAKVFSLLFKYEVGGSTEVLQDLSRADIRIELPVTQRFQLKVERKKSESETSAVTNTKFLEGGLKYNFEF